MHPAYAGGPSVGLANAWINVACGTPTSAATVLRDIPEGASAVHVECSSKAADPSA